MQPPKNQPESTAAESRDLRSKSDLSAGLEAMFKNMEAEFNLLAGKSENAPTEAMKYIYANQAIGISKAMCIFGRVRKEYGL